MNNEKLVLLDFVGYAKSKNARTKKDAPKSPRAADNVLAFTVKLSSFLLLHMIEPLEEWLRKWTDNKKLVVRFCWSMRN